MCKIEKGKVNNMINFAMLAAQATVEPVQQAAGVLFGLSVLEWGLLLGFITTALTTIIAALRNQQTKTALSKANDMTGDNVPDVEPEPITSALKSLPQLLGRKEK